MSVVETIMDKAQKAKKRIVLPEAAIDERVVRAARVIKDQAVAVPVLIGEPNKLNELAKTAQVAINDIEQINVADYPGLDKFARRYNEIRAKEQLSQGEARQVVSEPLFFGAMMVREGLADGMTAGSMSPTADVLRAAIKCVGLRPGIKIVSSCFIMIVPDCPYGEEGLFVFADCAVNPQPTAEQLADIAISTGETTSELLGLEPRIAMLSFSTYGSAEHEEVDRVKEATRLVKQRAPQIMIDGELQVDAAIIESVAKQKAAGSPLGGKANVLIFPDLNSGNIAYKLVERLAKAAAYGPVIQGLAKPVNDLSRGCSVDDIVLVSAITAVKAINS